MIQAWPNLTVALFGRQRACAGISADRLKVVPVGGGERKRQAIRAALSGGWLNVLITDHATALDLVRD